MTKGAMKHMDKSNRNVVIVGNIRPGKTTSQADLLRLGERRLAARQPPLTLEDVRPLMLTDAEIAKIRGQC